MRTPHEYIYVEATPAEADAWLLHRFGVLMYGEHCECCGDDYRILELSEFPPNIETSALVINRAQYEEDMGGPEAEPEYA